LKRPAAKNESIPAQMTTLPKIVIETADYWKCNIDSAPDDWSSDLALNVPMYLMGACGERSCMKKNLKIEIGKSGMDREFWGRVAKAINEHGMFDWDWNSLQKNVITPNLEHIRIACDIKSQSILERFEEDGYVFLNNWFDADMEEDEDEDGKPQYIRNPNRNSVFTHENAIWETGGVEY